MPVPSGKTSAAALGLMVLVASCLIPVGLNSATWVAATAGDASAALAYSRLDRGKGASDTAIYLDIPDARGLAVQDTPMGQVLELSGYDTSGSPGTPLLPYKTMRLLLPPDADWDTLKVELIRGE